MKIIISLSLLSLFLSLEFVLVFADTTKEVEKSSGNDESTSQNNNGNNNEDEKKIVIEDGPRLVLYIDNFSGFNLWDFPGKTHFSFSNDPLGIPLLARLKSQV